MFVCSKLKERISQLDQENTSLTKAHVERFVPVHGTEADSHFTVGIL